jgi:hypothetical protein
VPGVVALNRQNYAQDLQISVARLRRALHLRRARPAPVRRRHSRHHARTGRARSRTSTWTRPTASRCCAAVLVAVRQLLRRRDQHLHRRRHRGCRRRRVGAVGSDGVRRVRALRRQRARELEPECACAFETDGFREHSAAKRTASTQGEVARLGPTRASPSWSTPWTCPTCRIRWASRAPRCEADPRQASPRAAVQHPQVGGPAAARHRAGASVRRGHTLKLTGWRGRAATEQFQAIPVATQAPITHPAA